jgi:Leucine-rich repeat (LRR) protein
MKFGLMIWGWQEPHLVTILDLSDNLLSDLPDNLSLLVHTPSVSLGMS